MGDVFRSVTPTFSRFIDELATFVNLFRMLQWNDHPIVREAALKVLEHRTFCLCPQDYRFLFSYFRTSNIERGNPPHCFLDKFCSPRPIGDPSAFICNKDTYDCMFAHSTRNSAPLGPIRTSKAVGSMKNPNRKPYTIAPEVIVRGERLRFLGNSIRSVVAVGSQAFRAEWLKKAGDTYRLMCFLIDEKIDPRHPAVQLATVISDDSKLMNIFCSLKDALLEAMAASETMRIIPVEGKIA